MSAKVVFSPLVAALYEEMQTAYAALRRGDVGAALEVLEARCRVEDVEQAPEAVTAMEAWRSRRALLEQAPEGFFTPLTAGGLDHAAAISLWLKRCPELFAAAEGVLAANAILSDYGFQIVPD